MTGAAVGPAAVALVVTLLVAGLALVALHHFRRGTVLVAAALLVAAAARMLVPPRLVGLLSSRNRRFDIAWLAGLGMAVLLLTFAVPAPHG